MSVERKDLRGLIEDHVVEPYTIRNAHATLVDGEFDYAYIELDTTEFGYAPSISLESYRRHDGRTPWTVGFSTGSKMDADALAAFSAQVAATREIQRALEEGT